MRVPKIVLADRMGCLKGGVVANVVVPTPDYVRFATHYRFRPDFCEAADPESKGMVENLVGYAKDDLMVPQAPWIDLGAANAAAGVWCAEVTASTSGWRPDVPGAAGGDQLDDLPVVDGLGVHLRGHLPEVQARDVVGHLEDVVHVVGDQDDREAVVGEPADQVEHLLGLGDAQRRGRLVEDDELGVPQHRARDRHGLPLTAGQARDLLAQRPQRPHREAAQRVAGALLHRRSRPA